jgi:hypothetical protein
VCAIQDALNTLSRRVNTSPTSREAVSKAYEFALSRIGQDKDSGDIWSDYIQFLKVGEVRRRPATLNVLLTPVSDDHNVGGTAKNGFPAQGLPSRRPNSS